MCATTLEMAFMYLIYPGLAFVIASSLLLYGLLRKIAARMQNRVGPPVWQPVWDIIKLASKENLRPEQAKIGFSVWPSLSLSAILVASLIVPVAGMRLLAFSADAIMLLYFLVFTSASAYLSGFASANPFGFIGASRGLVQMLSYEVTMVISVLAGLVYLDTLMIPNAEGFLAAKLPLAALAFLLSVVAKSEIPPFHIPGAKQEIVSGYTTEYTGFRLMLIELSHMVKLFVLLSLGIGLFFGGSVGLLDFLAKLLILLLIVSMSRVVFARVRIDQALRLYWVAGAIALIDLVRVMYGGVGL